MVISVAFWLRAGPLLLISFLLLQLEHLIQILCFLSWFGSLEYNLAQHTKETTNIPVSLSQWDKLISDRYVDIHKPALMDIWR